MMSYNFGFISACEGIYLTGTPREIDNIDYNETSYIKDIIWINEKHTQYRIPKYYFSVQILL
jgi:hypothetical protein